MDVKQWKTKMNSRKCGNYWIYIRNKRRNANQLKDGTDWFFVPNELDQSQEHNIIILWDLYNVKCTNIQLVITTSTKSNMIDFVYTQEFVELLICARICNRAEIRNIWSIIW